MSLCYPVIVLCEKECLMFAANKTRPPREFFCVLNVNQLTSHAVAEGIGKLPGADLSL